MINIGIVGLGFMAATHLRAYREVPGARIVALCNPSGRNLDGDFTNVSGNVGSNEPFRVDLTNIRATKVFDDLLNDPSVHAIDICAPTAGHRDLAIAALEAGKHVLCEKPLSNSLDACRRMVEAAQKSGKTLATGFNHRYFPAIQVH